MSNIVSGIAQKRVIGSSARKSVLMLMASCASDDGTGIWTSKTNMAFDLEMSKRTVQSAIMGMVEMGVVYVSGKRACKNGYTIEYGINIAALSALKCTRAANAPVQGVRLTYAGDAPQDVQEMHPNSPLTIHEPSLEDIAGAEPVTNSKQKDKPPPKARLPEDWTLNAEDLEYAHSLKLNDAEIEEIANDFHTYWADRTDAGGRKSARGWRQTWRNRVRDQAPRFIRNRGMAGQKGSGGYGQGGSIASIVARRHIGS